MSATLFFWAAASICYATVLIHIFAGGRVFVRPFMAAEMEPDLKWMAYYSWHIATIVIAVVALGYTVAAIWSEKLDYAIISTGIAFSLVALAIGVAVKAKLPLRTFPVIPLFGLVVLLGLAGVLV
ncbi:MAG: hypothetical protein ABJO01_06525 [Parasphingorhabdus sp.]|uniref:hypothetical protein n=1 Tax=Parasphingorhabdus sp. TaxID=2709688 RepID=UPI00329A2FC5